uniref:Thrombospondin-like N-terminal domain-containing protein n=1 Tax=Scleropages formosus TaxID=113540 RepID=A0A8C9RCF8_SCLFO
EKCWQETHTHTHTHTHALTLLISGSGHFCEIRLSMTPDLSFRTPSQVFPRGLPEEFTLVLTLQLKRKTIRDNVYLLQISDEQGYPQFSLDLNGPERSLVLRAQGSGDSPTGCVFDGEGVESLLDFRWHKVALSVRAEVASLHVDCGSIETKPLGPREDVSTQGHTLLGIRALNGAAVEVGLWQVVVYCDPALAIQEACCEIPGARVSLTVPKATPITLRQHLAFTTQDVTCTCYCSCLVL